MLLAGKDSGKIGEISAIIKERNWVFVNGLNIVSFNVFTLNESVGFEKSKMFHSSNKNALFIYLFILTFCMNKRHVI